MNLFQLGDFILHSGRSSKFKIDCDALQNIDMANLAYLISKMFAFGNVIGVPMGGVLLARHLSVFSTVGCPTTLIVDDVLTTGKSMEEAKKMVDGPVQGIVIFERGRCPDWVFPLFTCNIPI